MNPQIAQYLSDNAARLKAQAQDPDLMKLKDWLRERRVPHTATINYQSAVLQTYHKLFTDFTLSPVEGGAEEQLVYSKGSSNCHIPCRLVMPQQLVKMLIQDAHLLLLHQGATDMMQFLQDKVYFPNLWKVCRHAMLNCVGCELEVKYNHD